MKASNRTIRRLVLFAAILGVLGSTATASAAAATLAFTANYAGDSVSVIDAATSTAVGSPIPVGDGPYSVAVTPDGRRLFVVNAGDSTVSVIDTRTRTTIGEPIAVGASPSTIAISPDGLTAYVTCEVGDEVVAIDTRSDQVIGTATGIDGPFGIAVAPDGKSVWVTSYNQDLVYVLDPQTLAPIGAPIPVGENPFVIAFLPNGRTAYVADGESDEVSVVDTSTRTVTGIPTGPESEPWGLGVTPDGRKLFVSDYGTDTVDVVETATNRIVDEFGVGVEPYEFGMSPNGKIAYLAEYGSEDVIGIDTATDRPTGSPIAIAGEKPWQVVVAPDQSPSAAFVAPSARVGAPAVFDASAASDLDGSIASWNWLFGDGGAANGQVVTHTYGAAGTFTAQLSVTDDEGCGGAQVFTGRTALCSGGASPVTHGVTVAPAPSSTPPPAATPPVVKANPYKLRFGRLIHNRRNGTARLQVRLPAAGSVLLTGPRVHLVSKKNVGPGSVFLTIHARVKLNRQLKKSLRAKVSFKVTYSPAGGTPATKTHSVVLQRAPRHKKH